MHSTIMQNTNIFYRIKVCVSHQTMVNAVIGAVQNPDKTRHQTCHVIEYEPPFYMGLTCPRAQNLTSPSMARIV